MFLITYFRMLIVKVTRHANNNFNIAPDVLQDLENSQDTSISMIFCLLCYPFLTALFN